MIPVFDAARVHKNIQKELENSVIKVMRSGKYILSSEVKTFEQETQNYLNVSNSVGVASGSDAIYLSLLALNIGSADEVITTPFTFFATASTIQRTGAKVVFADIDETFNISPKKIESAITNKTKAILPVHLFGQPANMCEIMNIAKQNRLHVIEDACQAFGAKIQINEKWAKVGAIGTFGVFSFFPTKTLGGLGDGGLVTTSNKELAEKIRILRVHGAKQKYYYKSLGINSRLDEVQAAMLRVKLKIIDKHNSERRNIAKFYNDNIISNKITKPIIQSLVEPVYHQYTIRTKQRDKLKEYLNSNEIGSMIYYPMPLHLQPVFSCLNYVRGDFPVAERACEEVLSLPIFPGLKENELKHIVKVINEF